jgi:hypothetical protein
MQAKCGKYDISHVPQLEINSRGDHARRLIAQPITNLGSCLFSIASRSALCGTYLSAFVCSDLELRLLQRYA